MDKKIWTAEHIPSMQDCSKETEFAKYNREFKMHIDATMEKARELKHRIIDLKLQLLRAQQSQQGIISNQHDFYNKY